MPCAGPIRFSTDMDSAVDGSLTLAPPPEMSAALRRHAPLLKQLRVDASILHLGLEIDGQLVTASSESKTHVAGMRTRLTPAFDVVDAVRLDEELLVHFHVRTAAQWAGQAHDG